MIINALSEYYRLLAEDEKSNVPPYYFSDETVKYCVVINKDGEIVDIESFDENKKGIELRVPEHGGRTAVGKPYFMCDKSQYIFGVEKGKETDEQKENMKKSFKEAITLHNIVLKDVKGESAKAIVNYFNNWDMSKTMGNKHVLEHDKNKGKILTGINIIFRLEGHINYLHEDEEIKQCWIEYCKIESEKKDKNDIFAICSVSGKYSKIKKVHTSIKGLTSFEGKSQCALVTYNCDSFEFYNKKQGYNASIGEKVAFEYTTVLNRLIASPKQHIKLNKNTVVVFWASSTDNRYADLFGGLVMGGNNNETEDKETIEGIKTFLEYTKNGIPTEWDLDENTKFYILSLSSNLSRVSIRFFYSSSFGKICESVKQHYKDIEIENNFGETQNNKVMPLWSLLNTTKRDKKPGTDSKEKLNPLLSGAMLKSVIQGAIYPQIILNAVIARIKAGDKVNRERAAVIKGFLNRKNRILNNREEINMSLNEESTNKAYILGRLFSVLEKVQKETLGKDAKTIKDSYFSSACSTPGIVFPRLLKLSQYHLSKIENYKGRYEKNIQELADKINGFPKHLSVEEQGMFIIGYYHQNKKNYEKNMGVEKND